MAQLHLIRSRIQCEWPSYFEEKTDVWIVGDARGYRLFQRAIRRAMVCSEVVRLPVAALSYSMRGCVLPVVKRAGREARVKFVERIVFMGRRPGMELVILGNRSGYLWLIECLERAAGEYLDRPWEHLHLDDLQDRRVVRRSVALNIRGAMRRWSRAGLQEYASMVFQRQPTYMPEGIGHLKRRSFQYESPVSGQFPFVLR